MRGGFFTRIEARAARGRKSKKNALDDLPVDYLHRLGLRGVANMNPRARHPDMQPRGDANPEVYVLGDVASRSDDKEGRALSGKIGNRLARLFPSDAGVMLDVTVRTRPMKDRSPKPAEVECFRPSIVASIEAAAPKSIIALGSSVLRWFFPDISDSILAARGRRFVARVGDHCCYVYPVMHPAAVLEMEAKEERVSGMRGDEWGDAFDRDVRAVFDEVESLPRPKPELADDRSLMEGVTMPRTVEDIARAITRFRQAGKTISIDIETQHLRPYTEGAKILTVAISNGKRTIAFPIDHPARALHGKDRQAVVKGLRELLVSGLPVAAHNAPFEMEWLSDMCGDAVLRGSRWHCTQVQAFMLDERRLGGCQKLDYKSVELLGFSIKSQTQGLDMGNLSGAPIDQLLRYNAIDAKYTYPIHREQMRRIKKSKIRRAYVRRMRVAAPIVHAQTVGVPVNTAMVKKLRRKYGRKIKKLEAGAAARPEVQEHAQRRGRFSLSSNDAVIQVFRDVLKRKEGRQGKKYSANEEALEKMKDRVPLARIVLEYRNLAKLKGTYLDKFDPDRVGSLVYPDGRIHCNFNMTFAETGRLSSSNPNNQNWPKRKDKHIRRIIEPPPGHVIVSSDYGQQEARVIGMASLDRRFVRALWSDYDIHMEWAERLAAAWPKSPPAMGCSNMKEYRTEVKSKWVFALFFGAGTRSVAVNMHMPRRVVQKMATEFWDEFRGVRSWQDRTKRGYAQNGYVETLTGRRRRYPLSHNQIINTPIQGTGADLTNDAFIRMYDVADERDEPWLRPVLQIHDDLSFFIPEDAVDDSIQVITDTMVSPPFDFVNVPTIVEVEQGRNWHEMETVGTFRADPTKPDWV